MAAPTYDVLLIDGDLPEITQHTTGIALTMQRVDIRLQTFLGEWILDTTQGIDYIGLSDISPAPVDSFSAIIRGEVEDTPGVVTVVSWVTTFDAPTAKITITGVIETEEGEVAATLEASPTAGTGNTWYLWPIAYTLG